jgi:hypothetical protein
MTLGIAFSGRRRRLHYCRGDHDTVIHEIDTMRWLLDFTTRLVT